MRFASGDEFRAWPAKAVTLFGMSGVGKTTMAELLRGGDWFHYSADYRIGTRYMGEHIVDNFKREAMRVPLLKQLLMSDSITIQSNIRFTNLSPLSTYLGKPGDPARGGLSFEEYRKRQAQHREAEIAALLDVPEFIAKSREIYGYRNFVCDSGGSLCEVVDRLNPADPVLQCLARNTVLVYIRGSDAHLQMLVERFRLDPKPIYYQPDYLLRTWTEYKRQHGDCADADVDPDSFAVWAFAGLLQHRRPIYDWIAASQGAYVIAADELTGVATGAACIELIARAIDTQHRETVQSATSGPGH